MTWAGDGTASLKFLGGGYVAAVDLVSGYSVGDRILDLTVVEIEASG